MTYRLFKTSKEIVLPEKIVVLPEKIAFMFNRFSKDDGKKLVDAEKGITNLHLAAYRKNIEMMGLFSIDFLLDKEPLTMTRKNKITQVVDKFGNTEYDYFRSK